MAYDDEERYAELGRFIFQQNPYGKDAWLRDGFQAQAKSENYPDPRKDPPKGKEHMEWEFDDPNDKKRIFRAIFIDYDYRLPDGTVQTEHLLIGYAGGGH